MSDDFDNGFYEEKRPRDHVVDAAKQVLLDRHFPRDGTQVYYGRQLEVWLERTFFHWITKKALNELVAEHRINFTPETTEHYTAHFYWPLRHRYPRRQIAEILGLIAEFSRPDFSRALGHERELLTDAAFARGGFQILQDRVREVDGKKWTMKITTLIVLSFAMASATAWKSRTSLVISSKRSSGLSSACAGISACARCSWHE